MSHLASKKPATNSTRFFANNCISCYCFSGKGFPMCCLPIRQVQKSVDITLNNNQIIPGRFAGWLVYSAALCAGSSGEVILSYVDLVPFFDQEKHPRVRIYERFYDGVDITEQTMVVRRNIPLDTSAWRVPCKLCLVGSWRFSIPPEGNRVCHACFKMLAEFYSCVVSG